MKFVTKFIKTQFFAYISIFTKTQALGNQGKGMVIKLNESSSKNSYDII